MRPHTLTDSIVASLVFSVIGIVVFTLAYWVLQKLSPFSIRKEIEEDQNVALGIIMAGVAIGIAIIIAAAING